MTDANHILDTVGMKCPQPVLRLAVRAPQIQSGEVLEIAGDCPTFEFDVRTWCQRLGKTLLSVNTGPGSVVRIQILF